VLEKMVAEEAAVVVVQEHHLLRRCHRVVAGRHSQMGILRPKDYVVDTASRPDTVSIRFLLLPLLFLGRYVEAGGKVEVDRSEDEVVVVEVVAHPLNNDIEPHPIGTVAEFSRRIFQRHDRLRHDSHHQVLAVSVQKWQNQEEHY
jgi:hypothetical protein